MMSGWVDWWIDGWMCGWMMDGYMYSLLIFNGNYFIISIFFFLLPWFTELFLFFLLFNLSHNFWAIIFPDTKFSHGIFLPCHPVRCRHVFLFLTSSGAVLLPLTLPLCLKKKILTCILTHPSKETVNLNKITANPHHLTLFLETFGLNSPFLHNICFAHIKF